MTFLVPSNKSNTFSPTVLDVVLLCEHLLVQAEVFLAEGHSLLVSNHI